MNIREKIKELIATSVQTDESYSWAYHEGRNSAFRQVLYLMGQLDPPWYYWCMVLGEERQIIFYTEQEIIKFANAKDFAQAVDIINGWDGHFGKMAQCADHGYFMSHEPCPECMELGCMEVTK